MRTIGELQVCAIVNRLIILTPKAKALGPLFSEEKKGQLGIQEDQGNNLNSSLEALWREIIEGKIATRERIILLMPDIPAINCKTIQKFVHLTPKKELGLFPLEQQEGTAMVLLNKTVHQSFQPRFGKKSLQKFLREGHKRGRPVKLFTTQKELIDIDELTDLKKWLMEKESQSKREEQLKQEWKKRLGNWNDSRNR